MPCFLRPSSIHRGESDDVPAARPLTADATTTKSHAPHTPAFSPPFSTHSSTIELPLKNVTSSYTVHNKQTTSTTTPQVLALLATTLSAPAAVSQCSIDQLPTVRKHSSHQNLRPKSSRFSLRPKSSHSSSNKDATMSVSASKSHRARDFLRDHHPHLPRSSKSADKSPKVNDKDPEYQQKKEEEKHMICVFEEKNSKEPLSPTMIMKDPSEKNVGHKSRYLRRSDFKMVKTIGTGTFARVDLVKLDKPQPGDENKVFALKKLRKVDVIKLKQIEHVKSERDVLAAVAGHPFITTMVASFSDHDCVYMILDYCAGGEIFTYLRKYKTFEEPTAKFYAAEVCLILEFLHDRKGVAYRDLKPENILLDADGHLKLVDFGFAKRLEGKQTYTLCGTPEYLAPETIKNTGHGNAVDWWAFGILIYEFLVGQPPFWDNNPMKLYEQIVRGKINYPTSMSPDAKDIVGKLCIADTANRLGNQAGRAKDVKAHAWFKDINWDSIYKRERKGPIIPQLKSKDDTRNFENYDAEPERRTVYTPDMQKKYDHEFNSF